MIVLKPIGDDCVWSLYKTQQNYWLQKHISLFIRRLCDCCTGFKMCSHKFLSFWLVVLPLTIIAIGALDDYRVVDTKNGKIRGRRSVSILNKVDFYSFKGIHHAKNPIGELRFKVKFQLIDFMCCEYFQNETNDFLWTGTRTDWIMGTRNTWCIWTCRHVPSFIHTDSGY